MRNINTKHRILIDCAFVSKYNNVTGIPRVVFKYIENLSACAEEMDIEVMAVYVNSHGVFDASPNLPTSILTHYPEAQSQKGRKFHVYFSDLVIYVRRNLRSLFYDYFSWMAANTKNSFTGRMITRLHRIYLRALNFFTHPSFRLSRVEVRSGDIIFMPAYWHDEAIESYTILQKKGCIIVPLVHDVLPITMPENYNSGWREHFRKVVLGLVSQADFCVYISHATKDEVERLLRASFSRLPPSRVQHHGYDFTPAKLAVKPSRRFGKHFSKDDKILLMVGTLEPKKGHLFVLDEMERYWQTHSEYKLLIVGRPGWLSEEIEQRISKSKWFGLRIFWLDDVEDAELEELYSSSYLYIAASNGEGFGLPVIEALSKNLPVLANSIKPFIEIGESYIDYFDVQKSGSLQIKLTNYLIENKYAEAKERTRRFSWKNWRTASAELLTTLIDMRSVIIVRDADSSEPLRDTATLRR